MPLMPQLASGVDRTKRSYNLKKGPTLCHIGKGASIYYKSMGMLSPPSICNFTREWGTGRLIRKE